MAIQGLRDTRGFVTDQRPKNWREGIMLLQPNGTAPLLALTSLMKSKKTDDPEFNWWEKSLESRRMALGANITTTSQTTITVASGATALKEGTLILIEHTGEVVLVSADPVSDTSITVVRGYSDSTPATIADITAAGVNPNIRVIGTAYEEGSAAPTGIAYDPTKRTNYTQIFRDTLEHTRTAAKTRLRTGDAVKEAKREAMQYHMIGLEHAFLFGKQWEGTRKGKPIRTTGGLLWFMEQYASANVVDVSGDTRDMEWLEGHFDAIFKYGSSEKVVFTGNVGMIGLQQVIRKNSNYQFMQGQKEFGMNVTRLITPFGELVIKTHPLFNQVTGGTTGGSAYYGLNSWFWVLDMDALIYRPFQDDDTKFDPDLAAPGVDGKKGGYLTEAGFEVHQPERFYLMKGFASGAADS